MNEKQNYNWIWCIAVPLDLQVWQIAGNMSSQGVVSSKDII